MDLQSYHKKLKHQWTWGERDQVKIKPGRDGKVSVDIREYLFELEQSMHAFIWLRLPFIPSKNDDVSLIKVW